VGAKTYPGLDDFPFALNISQVIITFLKQLTVIALIIKQLPEISVSISE
jgi:hypothetical protein